MRGNLETFCIKLWLKQHFYGPFTGEPRTSFLGYYIPFPPVSSTHLHENASPPLEELSLFFFFFKIFLDLLVLVKASNKKKKQQQKKKTTPSRSAHSVFDARC